MRDDLNKQMCERQRRGSGRKFGEVRHLRKHTPRDADEAPVREGMKSRYGYDDKSFNENLRPLIGAIRKAVGRPYAKFYSELSKTFDKRSVINQHILVHLKQYLATEVYVGSDGALYERNQYTPDSKLADSSTEFYVDPRDGLIKRNRKGIASLAKRRREREARAQAERDATFRLLDDGSELHLIDGLWFQFTLATAPTGHYVYDKPPDSDLFKYSWQSRARPWEKLTERERESFGVQRFVGERAYDVLTREHVFSEVGKPPLTYHATKRAASHRTLKLAGLAQ